MPSKCTHRSRRRLRLHAAFTLTAALGFAASPAWAQGAATQGKTIAEAVADPGEGVRVVGIRRESARYPLPDSSTLPLHERFVPRSDARHSAQAAQPRFGPLATSAPLPRRNWPAKHLKRGPNKHRVRWEARRDPASYRRAIDEAMRVPEFTPSDAAGPNAATVWTEIGKGIWHYDSNTNQALHRAGRCTKAAYAYDWQQRGTTLFVGTCGGGLWRYDWARNSWLQVSSSLAGSPSVGAFLVHPNNPRHMLIGTGDHARFQGSGLYRSLNGGSSWGRVSLNPVPDSFTQIRVDKSNPSVLMASTNKGIYRSENGGWTWTRVYAERTTDLVQDPRYHQYWYAGGSGVGVLESSDHGRSFHPRGTGITGTIRRVSVTVCDSAPNVVYALVEGYQGSLNNVYRSMNYGLSWQAIDTVDMIGWGQAFHTCAITVDPRDPDVLMVGMGGFQFTENATDPNVRWTRFRQPGHADYTSFTFIPSGFAPSNTWVLVTNDGGYYTYDYRTDRFYADGNLRGINAAQTLFTHHGLAQSGSASNLLLAGTQDNGVVRLDTSQLSMRKVQYGWGGDGGLCSWSRYHADTCVASVGGPPYARFLSSDRFTNVNGINFNLSQHTVPSLVFRQASFAFDLWTHDDRGQLYFMMPWHRAWQSANPNTTISAGINAIDLAAAPDVEVIASAFDGHVYSFTPGTGSNWRDMRRVRRTPPIAMTQSPIATCDRSPTQPNTVYLATGWNRPSRTFRSMNRGRSWTNCTGDLATLLPNANYIELIAHPAYTLRLFLATDVGVFRSDNGGRNWRRYMEGMPQVVNVTNLEVVTHGGQQRLRVATNGRGFWERVID